VLLTEIYGNARDVVRTELFSGNEQSRQKSPAIFRDDDIDVGTIVALIRAPQPPEFAGLGIVLVVDIQDSVYIFCLSNQMSLIEGFVENFSCGVAELNHSMK
jgi:hypothetical protein